MLLSVKKVISFHLQKSSIIKFPFFTSIYVNCAEISNVCSDSAMQCPTISLTYLAVSAQVTRISPAPFPEPSPPCQYPLFTNCLKAKEDYVNIVVQ